MEIKKWFGAENRFFFMPNTDYDYLKALEEFEGLVDEKYDIARRDGRLSRQACFYGWPFYVEEPESNDKSFASKGTIVVADSYTDYMDYYGYKFKKGKTITSMSYSFGTDLSYEIILPGRLHSLGAYNDGTLSYTPRHIIYKRMNLDEGKVITGENQMFFAKNFWENPFKTIEGVEAAIEKVKGWQALT